MRNPIHKPNNSLRRVSLRRVFLQRNMVAAAWSVVAVFAIQIPELTYGQTPGYYTQNGGVVWYGAQQQRVHHPATAYNPAPGYVQHHANNQVPSAELMRRPEIQPQRTRRPPIDTAVLPPFNSLAFPRKRISRFQATMLLNNRMATTSRRRLTETVGLPRTVRTLSIGSDSSTLSPALIQVMVTALRPPATPPMPSKRRSRDNNQRSSQTCNRIRTFKIN